jgi:hypothetical protein
MDKTAIKNYAVAARKKLIEAVGLKANELLQGEGFLTNQQKMARTRLMRDDLSQVVEAVAYTWFNRLIALRFMEVNDYLPSGIRILSSVEAGRIEPDALREVARLDYIDPAKVAALKVDKDFNAPEKLYRYILISQCNALSSILPGMFQRIDDYTELLLPDTLYSTGGIVHDLVNAIHEDNFNIINQGQIEIIGWLYQYYITELSEIVYDGTFSREKIPKELVPAATTIYTPAWVVKYMVENSLGRLWLERHPNDELRKGWKYYVDEAEQEPEVAAQLEAMRQASPINNPQDIKFIDPCMGSGHILVYAFDVLFQIYRSVGYVEREIPNLILLHNLHGLDIDDRAGQLAYFALMMKARGYNRRFFRQDVVPQPMVFSADGDPELSEFGSLVKVEELGDAPELPDEYNLDNMEVVANHEREVIGWNYRSLLARKFDVVVTNPPYLGSGRFSQKLSEYVVKNYTDSKSDLSMAMYKQALSSLLNRNGYVAFITTSSWMFLTSFGKLREFVLHNYDLVSLVDFGSELFDGKVGHNLIVAWVCRNSHTYSRMTAIRLVEYCYSRRDEKEPEFYNPANRFIASPENFEKIPGGPIAYWVGERFFHLFDKYETLKSVARARSGIKTGDNERFIRFWWEVSSGDIIASICSYEESLATKSKWVFYNKGGEYQNWYGNDELVLNFSIGGSAIKSNAEQFGRSYDLNAKDVYFHQGITWTALTSAKNSFRFSPVGRLFDSNKGPMLFPNNEKTLYNLLAFFISPITQYIVAILNPSISLQNGDMDKLPIVTGMINNTETALKSKKNVEIAIADWTSFETSWDFQCHPLIESMTPSEREGINLKQDMRGGFDYSIGTEVYLSISNAFEAWERECNERFTTLKANEEELNRIFIDIYGLQDELTPDVEDKDVTVRKADKSRDIRSFISYAVGCMFGRYSLDAPGLAFAGGTFNPAAYKTFAPVKDNIIPINHIDYFDSDIVMLFVEFVRTVYGEATLGENLDFIANALYPNASGTARERIRRYFLNVFYKDHLKIYQKRPIYWLLDSGKKDGFKALFYLHRYDKYTAARARTDYLHPLQRKYDAEIKTLQQSETTDPRERAANNKTIAMLQAKMDECRTYDQVIAHIAHRQIELDLDDGVRVNYAKFQGVEVPKDDGKVEKMDLLGKI